MGCTLLEPVAREGRSMIAQDRQECPSEPHILQYPLQLGGLVDLQRCLFHSYGNLVGF